MDCVYWDSCAKRRPNELHTLGLENLIIYIYGEKEYS